MERALLVPAAGRGTRLGSPLPKLLTPVAGRPMIDHVLDRYAGVAAHTVLVVEPSARPIVEAHLRLRGTDIQFAEQASPTGMLNAILEGREAVLSTAAARVWITWCDQVGISASTVDRLVELESQRPDADAIFPVVQQTPPYIHFDTDTLGRPVAVRQRREGDDMPDSGLSDSGLFSLSATAFTLLADYARTASPGATTGELNFLPFLAWLAARAPVITFAIAAEEARGVNTPEDLAAAERSLS